MRKSLALICLLFCLLLPVQALAEGEEQNGNLLYNGDFSVYTESAGLPAGWDLIAYGEAESEALVYEDESTGRTAVAISAAEANDVRVCQDVAVEPNTVYILTGELKTQEVTGGTGATLSIDNFSIDGTYCYSRNLHGTEDWQQVSMHVRTGDEQTVLRIALRLGGYGTTATGAAFFSNVTLYEAEGTVDGDIIDLMTENGAVSGVSASTPVGETDNPVFTMFFLIVLCGVICAGAYVLLYRKVLCCELDAQTLKRMPYALWLILAGAFISRLVLSLIFFGHPTDINCFMAWGNAMMNNGPGQFYTGSMFADYPPGYMYICGFLSWVCKLLQIPYGSDAMAYLFKMPATIADLASGYLVYRIARKNKVSESFSLVLCGVIALNPVMMFISGAWGQIDTLLTLLLVCAFYLFTEDKGILAGAIYGAAILMKPQALMLGPIFAVAYMARVIGPDWKKQLIKAALSVLAALGTIFLLSLPCKAGQPWCWLVDKYTKTAGSYPYMSIEAYNLGALLGGNWKAVDTLVLGVPFRIWGTVGIGLSVAFSIGLYLKGRDRNKGALYLAAGLMIMLIFSLGHYMHERYMIPALLLIIMAYVYYRDRRILLAFGAVTTVSLLNVTAAMYVVDHQAARGTFYNGFTAVCSAMMLLATGYLAYVSVQILWRYRLLPPLPAPAVREAGRKTGKSEGFHVLPALPTDCRLRYTRRDWAYLGVLVLLYGAVALTNLGTTSFPQTHWESTGPGETVRVDFGEQVHLGAYWVNGNIGNGGTLMLTGDNGREETFQQTYDDMFRWTVRETDMVTTSVILTVYAGKLDINEIAFFDAEGNRLSIKSTTATEGQRALFDEQDTVPGLPSYYNGMYFDELYHGRTAYEHLHNLTPYENSHPPLGKIFIMLGVWIFGMCPFGWRIVGALFGIGMLPVFYAFSKRLFKDSRFALVATALFAFDFMHFTQTRIATIDVYAVFFILLMYYYMYQYIQMNFFVDGLKKTWKPLGLAGLFFGVGAACKWTCIYAGAGLAILLCSSLIARYLEYDRIMRTGTEQEKKQVSCYWAYLWKTLGLCCVFYILVPVSIYALSYLPYYIYEASQNAGYGLKDLFGTFWRYQTFMFEYHSGLNATHPYQSAWYSWPFTIKPMWYYFCSEAKGAFVSTMSASGNPAVWWVSSVAVVLLLIERLTGRVKADRGLQIICVGILANYLPWVLVSRCTFIYHFFATVPFIILGAVYLLQTAEKRDQAGVRWAKWAWLGLALLLFILLYPGLSGLPVSKEWAAFIKLLPGGKLMYGA